MQNKVQLIAYVDRLANGGIQEFEALLNGPLSGLFGGAHLLPFFHPIDGADAGFDPIDHSQVDRRLGDWESLKALARGIDITADLIVNHISEDSPQFRDYLRNGPDSVYAGMFLTPESVFPDGPTEADLARIYRPRPSTPFVWKTLRDGSRKRFWATFTEKQIDLDVRNVHARAYLRNILRTLSGNGVKVVRLDAVGYAIKTPGTNCFMTAETYEFIRRITGWARELGMEVLAETHTHYRRQIETARHVDWVYDFALPPLILHSIFQKDARSLKRWLDICPRNAVTVLDTHDGIGVMDIGPDAEDPGRKGLIEPRYVDAMVKRIHSNSDGVSRRASRHDVGNLDLYQVNCTYYDALGRSDNDYLIARLIQFFAPGVPQVYYVGLLAGVNDVQLFGKTRSGRDVNRRYYARAEIEAALTRPVVRSLIGLIRFRNTHPSFDGPFVLAESADHSLTIRRQLDEHWSELHVDFRAGTFNLDYSHDGRSLSTRSLDALEV
ncbi:MAG: sucrose phosphorylase [Pseudomonadota bacterium]